MSAGVIAATVVGAGLIAGAVALRSNPPMRFTPDASLTFTPAPLASLDLTGKRIAVVGGTNGLGRAIAKAAASRGADVTVIGQTFRDAAPIKFIQADLSLLKEAARVASLLPAESLDAVVFTTGIITAPNKQVTPEGIERDMAISSLSRLVELRGLAPRLGVKRTPTPAAPSPRVFIMGFPGAGETGNGDLNAEKGYKPIPQHMNTVAVNEALELDGAKRYPHIGVYGLNPGLIKTDIRNNYLGEGTFACESGRHSTAGVIFITSVAYLYQVARVVLMPACPPSLPLNVQPPSWRRWSAGLR